MDCDTDNLSILSSHLQDLTRFRPGHTPVVVVAGVVEVVGGDGVSSDSVLCETTVAAGSRLQGYGVDSEVLQHVEDAGEPHVLHPTLTISVDCHADMLGSTLEVEGENIFSSPRLALSHQEHPVTCDQEPFYWTQH